MRILRGRGGPLAWPITLNVVILEQAVAVKPAPYKSLVKCAAKLPF